MYHLSPQKQNTITTITTITTLTTTPAKKKKKNQIFFEVVSSCRRRLAQKWQFTPLSPLLTLRSEFHLLQKRATIIRIRLAIAVRRMSLFEAFQFFDSDRKGGLSAGKLWAGLDWLEVHIYMMYLWVSFDVNFILLIFFLFFLQD